MSAKILFIEDDSFNREVVSEYLNLCQYDICALPDGTNFLHYLANFRPDLILLDLKLPEIDGFTLIEQAKQSKWSDIPIVILSAYGFSVDKKRAQQLGARRFLVKPMVMREIYQVIKEELKK